MADRSGRIELIMVRPVVQPYLSDNFTLYTLMVDIKNLKIYRERSKGIGEAKQYTCSK